MQTQNSEVFDHRWSKKQVLSLGKNSMMRILNYEAVEMLERCDSEEEQSFKSAFRKARK